MSDPTGTDAAKPAVVFVTERAWMHREDPTGTEAGPPATRFVVGRAGEREPGPDMPTTAGVEE